MTANTGSSPGASAAPSPGSYLLDPERTHVHVGVKAMFGLFTVHSSMRLRSGEIVVAAIPTGSSVTAAIESASFSSGNVKRDRDVTAAGLLDAAAFPEITFESDTVRQDGDGWVVTGTVSAHGQNVITNLQVTNVALQDGALICRATARLQRADFGITKKKGMVGPSAHITIDAIATPT